MSDVFTILAHMGRIAISDRKIEFQTKPDRYGPKLKNYLVNNHIVVLLDESCLSGPWGRRGGKADPDLAGRAD